MAERLQAKVSALRPGDRLLSVNATVLRVSRRAFLPSRQRQIDVQKDDGTTRTFVWNAGTVVTIERG